MGWGQGSWNGPLSERRKQRIMKGKKIEGGREAEWVGAQGGDGGAARGRGMGWGGAKEGGARGGPWITANKEAGAEGLGPAVQE